ncbi:phage major capsid protein [Flavitalea sp.]|nr:phage major capsid protein [Flavitalea sp.]
MDPIQLKAQLEALEAKLKAEVNAAAKAEITAQIDTLKGQLASIETLKTENIELKGKVATLETNAVANQKWINEQIAKQKEFPQGGAQPNTFDGVLGKMLDAKKDALKQYREGNGKGFSIEIDKKAVAIMGSSTHLTGSYFVQPTVVPGVISAPYEETHMRNILPVGTTNSNIIRYIRDNGGEGAPTTVAEGSAKPQADRDLAIYDAPVRKIAVHFRVPEEMIEDIPYLQSFLTMIGLEEVAVVEDDQILYGNNVGNNLSGLFPNATTFSAGTSTVTAPNEFDVLRAARKQLRNAKLNGPLVALVAPDDYFNMTSRKDTSGNYMFLSAYGVNLGQQIGINIIEHTSVVEDDFLVMQPRAAMIFDRAGTTVRFFDQDQDNAIKNLITIVIEKRIALPIFRPAGIIKGTFSTATTALLPAS